MPLDWCSRPDTPLCFYISHDLIFGERFRTYEVEVALCANAFVYAHEVGVERQLGQDSRLAQQACSDERVVRVQGRDLDCELRRVVADFSPIHAVSMSSGSHLLAILPGELDG